MRRTLIVGNWKMNHVAEDTVRFFEEFHVEIKERTELAFCVPFTDLYLTQKLLAHRGIKWGAQNVYPADKGAYTGEISPAMLKEVGCTYVICGHSERRLLLNESDSFVGKKVRFVIENGMTPILCVGETKEERDKEETERRITEEIDAVLKELDENIPKFFVIAYEPVWAIGTGEAASPDDAQKVAKFIRHLFEIKVGYEKAESIHILYGGSIQSRNVASFVEQKDIDGVLIGGAALSPQEMSAVYEKASLKEDL